MCMVVYLMCMAACTCDFPQATYQSHEEECSVAIMGNTYIIDLSGMQQINEDTGNARSIRRTVLEPPKNVPNEEVELEDERGVALREDPKLGASFVQALFGVLYEVFNSMVRKGGVVLWQPYNGGHVV